MKIGIFGHSSAVWRDYPNSRCLLLQNQFPNYQINWYGVPDSSEDRILKLVSKYKSFDLYIVFHSSKEYVYCPFLNRDFNIYDLKKAATNDSHFQKFKERSERYSGYIPELQQIIKTYTSFWLPDQKDLELRFKSNLILLSNALKNKNTIHVAAHYPDIKNFITYGKYSKTLSHLCYVNGTEEQFASALTNEIKLSEIDF
jgi:hypothetical protein